jgi:hypothetical protein
MTTRFRDLIDLVAIITGASVDAASQTIALVSEFDRRHLMLPPRFDCPDRSLWETGYAAEAARSLLEGTGTLDEALAIVRPFVDPILNRTAGGSWNSRARRWDGNLH